MMANDENDPRFGHVSTAKTIDQEFVRSPLRCNLTAELTPLSKRKVVYSDRFIPSHVRRVLNFNAHDESPPPKPKKEKMCATLSGPLLRSVAFRPPDKQCKVRDIRNEYSTIHEKQFQDVYKTVLVNELLDARVESLNAPWGSNNYAMDTSDRVFHFTRKESNESCPSLFTASPSTPCSPSSQKLLRSGINKYRRISRHPFKVLDAPGLPNDYYLNLLDWSKDDVVAVALGQKIYLWEFKTCNVSAINDRVIIDHPISCVKWSQDMPHHLSFSTNIGELFLFDINQLKCVRKRQLSCGQRLGCLDWNENLITAGCRDGAIRHIDARTSSISEVSQSSVGHVLEVCGLKWDGSGKNLASGGNDNKIFLWDISGKGPITSFGGHQGAVKALTWSPHEHGILASGGGSADKCIKFWNILTCQSLSSINTKSQVCNLHWSSSENEIVSSHGFSSNAINLWSYPSMDRLVSLKGHNHRVVYMSNSPDGDKIVTGSADETLRFWDIFNKRTTVANKVKTCDFDICGSLR